MNKYFERIWLHHKVIYVKSSESNSGGFLGHNMTKIDLARKQLCLNRMKYLNKCETPHDCIRLSNTIINLATSILLIFWIISVSLEKVVTLLPQAVFDKYIVLHVNGNNSFPLSKWLLHVIKLKLVEISTIIFPKPDLT